jgi:carboxymethylenebutenolidase
LKARPLLPSATLQRFHVSSIERCRLLITGTIIVMFAIVLPSAKADATRVVGPVSKLELTSGGRRVEVDRYAPLFGRDKHRNILVLHGAGGMLFDGARMRRVARALSANGYTAFVLHYFNRTRTIYARDSAMMKNFDTWDGSVREGIKWIAEQRQFDARSSKIGVYGYSLGGFLALAAASDNPKVGAVVEQSGGIWNNQTGRIGQLPPVLVIHGEQQNGRAFRNRGETAFEKFHPAGRFAGRLGRCQAIHDPPAAKNGATGVSDMAG